ncbi:MAG: CotH kinase family protein, partial [Pirellulales bacterium]
MRTSSRRFFSLRRSAPKRSTKRRNIGGVETLESRLVLDGGPVITEFMANNNTGIVDEDGDRSDWIEIYNDGPTAANLAGWRLTDSAGNPDKWVFPAVDLAPRAFLTVFASQKDRAAAGEELHTNFGLASEGEYLSLIRPDDTIAFETTYPQQLPDISYGVSSSVETVPLFDHGMPGAALVPNPAGPLPADWTSATFDDTGWIGAGATAAGPFGYDTGASETLSPQAATLALNPLGYWRMSETAGASVANLGSLGLSANGTPAGAANLNVAGPRPAAFPGFEADNSAMNFDGVNDALDVGGGSFMSNMAAFSLMGWIRPASFTATRVGLFGQNDALEFGFIDGAASTVQMWTPSGGSVNVNYPFPRNEWHHIAAVGDGSALRVYFDGNLAGTAAAATNNYGTSASGFRIGGNGVFDATGNFFTGDIDEVAAFNYALSQAQIQQVVGAATLGAGAPGGTVDYTPLIGTDIEAQMLGVNSTALVRVPFTVTGSAEFDSLTLKMRYDDGFVAYLNGIEVARRNAPATLLANSAATSPHEDSQAVVDELIDISTFSGVLQLGDNLLAIHALNSSASNTDFLISPSLEGRRVTSLGTELRYFTTPTPNSPNGVGTADLGPIISNVQHTPNEPLQAESIVVTAAVAPSFAALGSVQLRYRVMYNAEIVLAMVDDGSVGGDVAGDGIYTAVIPGNIATPGQMVRWRVTATDAGANNSRWPLFFDPLNSEEYLGTVVRDPALSSNLPVFHWFLPPGQQGAADSDTGARSALFYDGEFYDNVRFDIHGQSSRSFPKKSYDVDFNSDHRFRLNDDVPRMKDINILTNYADKTRLRNTLAYETFRDSGSTYHLAFPIRVQQNGVFFSVADFVEDGDDVFTERLGRNPDGALYKMYNRFDSATGEKKTRRDENNADLQALFNGVHQANIPARTNYLWDNVNIPAMISYMAGTMIASNYDCCHKNYYLYRDVPVSEGGTGEWEMIPWDVDLSWGKGWSQQSGYLHNQMTPDFPLYQGEADINDQPLTIEVSKRNDLLNPLFNTPGVRDMYLRRIRTLMDQLIQPASTPLEQRVAEQRIDELVALIGADGLADQAKWGTWQNNGDWATQITMLKDVYLGPRRDYL